jgi:glycosyltransferase involved in cell wall biosynthesis
LSSSSNGTERRDLASKRLLHVFATFSAAGPQVRTIELIRAFGPRFDHAVLAMDGCYDACGLLPSDSRLRRIPPPPKAGTARTSWRLRRVIAQERPDLLLTYNWGALDAGLAARTLPGSRWIHHEDGFRPDESSGLKPHRNFYRRLILPGADRVVVISENLRRIALERWKLPPAKVAFIPNGIDVEAFAARGGNHAMQAMRRELGIPLEAVVVGSVGHLRREKNFSRLLRAFQAARIPDAHLLLLGEGPEGEGLKHQAEQAGIAPRVHFAGYRSDPLPAYRAMDLFALSSDTEQMPIALLEAMACGLPVAATDVGDVSAMLPGEQAQFVVPTADEEGLGAALARLGGDRDLRSRLGQRNHARVRERYTRNSMLAAYEELWS